MGRTFLPIITYLNWLIKVSCSLVAYWLCRLLFFHYKIYRKTPMMKTSTIVLSMLLFVGITIKANAIPTSTKNSTPNCMMQVRYFDQCKQICKLVPACKYFTYCYYDSSCYLKKERKGYKDHTGCESGSKNSEFTQKEIEYDGGDMICP